MNETSKQNAMTMNDQLLDAFTEINDAAYAMGQCQLAQATNAAARLEAARTAFHKLFMDALKAEAAAARHST